MIAGNPAIGPARPPGSVYPALVWALLCVTLHVEWGHLVGFSVWMGDMEGVTLDILMSNC